MSAMLWLAGVTSGAWGRQALQVVGTNGAVYNDTTSVGEIPRLRASLSSTWSYQQHNLTATANYISSISMMAAYSTQEDGKVGPYEEAYCEYGRANRNADYLKFYPDCKVKSMTTLDLAYAFNGFRNTVLSFNIANVLNTKAPYDPSYFTAARADRPIPDEERAKISMFSNVPEWGVISMWDVDTIYKVPRMLHEQGLDGLICDKLRINTPPAKLTRWDELVYEVEHPQQEVAIAMVGKYVDLSDSYKSLNEALRHAGMKNHARVKIDYVDSETITAQDVSRLAKYDAILVPGGFGQR
eukprot:gene15175-17380_t